MRQYQLKETKEIQFCAGVWIYPKDYLSHSPEEISSTILCTSLPKEATDCPRTNNNEFSLVSYLLEILVTIS